MDRGSIPSFQAIITESGERKDLLAQLEVELNMELRAAKALSASWPQNSVAHFLVSFIEQLVCRLESFGYILGRIDYGGDTNPAESEQIYGNRLASGSRLIIHFTGFSCQVEWEP